MPVPQGYPTAKKGTSDGNSAYYGGDGVNPAKAKINFSVLQEAEVDCVSVMTWRT